DREARRRARRLGRRGHAVVRELSDNRSRARASGSPMIAGKPRLARNVVRGELPDGEVVVSIDGGSEALNLNPIGDAVLGLCDGSRTIAEIAQFVRDTLDVPPGSDVDRDIGAMLERLVRAGVIEAIA